MRIFFTALAMVLATGGTDAQVLITGTAKNYKDSVFYISEQGGFHNITQAWRDKRVKVVIDRNDSFSVAVPEQGVGSWMIKTENGYQFFDLVGGQQLELRADFSKTAPLLATGLNAADFNYPQYAGTYVDRSITEKYLGGIRNKSIDSALLYRKEYAAYKKSILDQYRQTNRLSDTYYKWLSSKYAYEPYERTLVENIKNRDSVDNTTLDKLLQKGINDEYAALNTVEYNDLVSFFMYKKFKETNSEKPNKTNLFNFARNNLLAGATREVFLSRMMAFFVKDADSVYNPVFEQYDQLVKNNWLKDQIINARRDYADPVKETSESIAGDNSFAAIFKKYKGKIVYVDFWASWCAPCRTEMPNAARLKEKLKTEEIVFVYFGYNDREKAWQKAREQLDIKGEHYLLSEQMIRDANALFGINGIPHYAIIDREGKIISKRAERPGEVYEVLMKLLKK
ncbi:MAG: TlpA disulfide reductase family protein [Chitinophagaceae bacterium]